MIIAISTNTNDLDQPVSENFGRSQWFCLYDTDTENIKFVENIAGSAKQNVGIKTINFLLEQNVDTVLSGRFGSITTVLLRERNVQIIILLKPKILSEIINQLKNRNL